MARVRNWQIGREMSYWYPESRPKRQFAAVFDINKCIGCLRCVEACKAENNVPRNAHQFRTWVERYVYLEGEESAHIDSQQDPVNIEASGSEKEFRFANRYKDAKVEKAFFGNRDEFKARPGHPRNNLPGDQVGMVFHFCKNNNIASF